MKRSTLNRIAGVPASTGPLAPEAERLANAEASRHLAAMLEIIVKYPAYRAHLAYTLLGGALGVCDTFGVDAQKFIDDLRRTQPMPAVLVPPKDGAS